MTQSATDVKLLGVDPGPAYSAYCWLVDGAVGEHEYLPNLALLEKLRIAYCDQVIVVVETPQAQDRPLGPQLRNTIWWAARFVEALDNAGSRYFESDERDDCLWLTGNPSGSNASILLALKKHFGDKSQRTCNACNGSGVLPGARKATVKKCPGCKGNSVVTVNGPLHGLNEHERSALVAALCHHQRLQSQRTAV